ncbi:helix-turn-helix transcriptional regulator [Mucilaginibacter sp. KACC 22773]|uniref:helix-turn-helix transcriptional regulator n=1 Tax=Mucilaginibacter sp. KACC 22773 TaxID=3025671 RepID=UPI00236600AA|nr:helix-turn-helix transcriptional regulator [Mucilaginibacter sp. KACC 22773]WDF75925.1 helix-turn-helix transcriptional regulator [Mucilaginibacter sp. KACC 22773]
MLQLEKGKYFGIQNKAIHLDNLIVTDTEYTYDKVDWHTHENPYFTFLLTGNMQETNKKESYECNAGTLLFHNWQDAHCNVKHPGYTRGFHIELEQDFFERYQLPLSRMEGSLKLDNPVLKLLFRNMYMETKYTADIELLIIRESLFKVFGFLTGEKCRETARQPAWVKKIKEVLNDADAATLSWDVLAAIAQVHPVHLSRSFPTYFNTTVGDYLKKLRINQAAVLLAKADVSLTQIGYECGFADQSHFIRSFKQAFGVTPLQYRKIITAR